MAKYESPQYRERSFGRLTNEQMVQLKRIHPIRDYIDILYYPCGVSLSNGETHNCVYIVNSKEYISGWLIWPEDDAHKKSILIEDVVKIEESPSRLRSEIAQKIYKEGESGMGYLLFILKFRDGSTQSYQTGNLVDFVPLPAGRAMSDVVDVYVHEGRFDPQQLEGLPYYWCLYSE